jgi:hypothetical protein
LNLGLKLAEIINLFQPTHKFKVALFFWVLVIPRPAGVAAVYLPTWHPYKEFSAVGSFADSDRQAIDGGPINLVENELIDRNADGLTHDELLAEINAGTFTHLLVEIRSHDAIIVKVDALEFTARAGLQESERGFSEFRVRSPLAQTQQQVSKFALIAARLSAKRKVFTSVKDEPKMIFSRKDLHP